MKSTLFITSLALLLFAACDQPAKETTTHANDSLVKKQEPPKDTSIHPGVFFVNIKEGDKLKSPVIIQMGVVGMQVEPAGKAEEGKGHHHLIIDGTYVEKDQTVPMDKKHIHFGKGQTSDTLKLKPGKHTLTLQFANGLHQSYGKEWSKTIGITVIK